MTTGETLHRALTAAANETVLAILARICATRTLATAWTHNITHGLIVDWSLNECRRLSTRWAWNEGDIFITRTQTTGLHYKALPRLCEFGVEKLCSPACSR